MRSALATLALGSALVLGLAACESVPDIAFAAPDATTEGGATDAANAADANDQDGSANDAAVPCADGVPPPGATRCCGPVPCYGGCTPGDCSKCQQQCTATNAACCTAKHPPSCTSFGTACP